MVTSLHLLWNIAWLRCHSLDEELHHMMEIHLLEQFQWHSIQLNGELFQAGEALVVGALRLPSLVLLDFS
jgi:hypothetical protein